MKFGRHILTIVSCFPVLWGEPATAKTYRIIKQVEAVSVEVPVGNAPRLPYQLWTTYSDGKGEYRQVKWLNTSEATENAEANPAINPIGTIYKVRGYLIGDNSTPKGYPISAEVKVVERNYNVPSCIPVAEPLPLNQVIIDGDNRLTWNRNLDIDHLLGLSRGRWLGLSHNQTERPRLRTLYVSYGFRFCQLSGCGKESSPKA